MPTMLVRVVFFVSSFAPLLIVFALLDSWGSGWPSLLCLVVAAVSVASLPAILRVVRGMAAVPIASRVAKRKDSEALTFVATFLVPFLTVTADAPRKRYALAVFVVLIAVFYVQGEMYFWNPVLSLRGYRALEVELPTEETVTVITARRFVKPGREVWAIPLGNNIYWEPNE